MEAPDWNEAQAAVDRIVARDLAAKAKLQTAISDALRQMKKKEA